jgi:hypothetical protein
MKKIFTLNGVDVYLDSKLGDESVENTHKIISQALYKAHGFTL